MKGRVKRRRRTIERNLIDVLEVCFSFADLPEPRKRLKNKIEEQLEAGADDEYKQYDRENLLQLMHRLLPYAR